MTIEKAIEVLKNECYVFNPMNFDRTTLINTALDTAIESLEHKPKSGHWIRANNGKYHWYVCSCCDATADSDAKMIAYKYCPNCGAKMESEDKE